MLEVGLGPFLAAPFIPGLGVFKEVSVALPRWGQLQCVPGNTLSLSTRILAQPCGRQHGFPATKRGASPRCVSVVSASA